MREKEQIDLKRMATAKCLIALREQSLQNTKSVVSSAVNHDNDRGSQFGEIAQRGLQSLSND